MSLAQLSKNAAHHLQFSKSVYNLTSLMFRRDHKVITTANGVFAIGGSIVTAKVSKNIKSQVPNPTQAYKILYNIKNQESL